MPPDGYSVECIRGPMDGWTGQLDRLTLELAFPVAVEGGWRKAIYRRPMFAQSHWHNMRYYYWGDRAT